MKIDFDKKLLKYAIYISITAIIIYIAFLILFNIGNILKAGSVFIGNIITLLKPLLIGIVIAYLLYPLSRLIEKFLERNKIFKIKSSSNRRMFGIVFSYICVIAIVLSLICGVYFMIGGQLSNNTNIINIINDISIYLSTNSFTPTSINETIENFNSPVMDFLQPYIIGGANFIQEYLANNIGRMTSSILSIGSSVATFFIALVISIYLLKDSEYFIDLCKKLYNLIFKNSITGNKISYIFKVIHEVFGKYIRGQLLEAFFVGVLSAIALAIAGIDYAFVIGIIAGICNMIPYVGPIVGTILAATMGLLSGSPIKILYAIVAMLIVQQIDNNLLAPKIVGNSVGLHAVFTMMAILIGGNIGGLLGMLIAVPIAASFKVLFNNWYNRHMNTHN